MKTIEPDVPATIRGWESEGRAKVELLARTEELTLGQIVTVGIRPDGKGRKASDFSFHNKQGLRLGGIVVMRKLRLEEGAATCRSVEPITMRDNDGATFVMQEAAVCILPPPPGTAMVKEALVAMLGEAMPARSLSEGVSKILPQLDAPAVFGNPGLAYFGRLKSGDPVDVLVGAEPGTTLSPNELVSRMLTGCPKDIIKDSRTSGTSRQAWTVCPIFRVPVDPDRSSKLSAQAINLSYGTAEDASWTRGIVILRTVANRWHLCDASPIEDGNASKLAALQPR
jgi:hypothetical protein